MVGPITWNGTVEEFRALSAAVNRACECPDKLGWQTATRCAAHQMLCKDQRAVDGLLFARRIAARLRCEEWRRGAERTDSIQTPDLV
jgi:hypothetical protein